MKPIEITQLKKPNIFQICFGTLISLSEEKKICAIQNKIGNYSLVSEVSKKNNQFKKFAVGVYTDGKEKVFIKTWNGKMKDVDYYSLVNELRINDLLHKKLYQSKYAKAISVPEVKKAFRSEEALSVVFEYIEGQPLHQFALNEQIKVTDECLDALKTISKELTNTEENYFIRRSSFFYFFTLPFLTVLLAVSQPKYASKIIKSFFRNIFMINDVLNDSLVISHRDLNPQNILIRNGVVYIIDWERAAFTLGGYDLARLSIEPDFYNLSGTIKDEFLSKVNNFLRIYIAIHSALDSSNLFERKHYLSLLN